MELSGVNIAVGYENRAVLRDINFSAQTGQLISLIGLNGSGKSTLLFSIAGLQPLLSGSLKFNGESISKWSANQRAQKMAIVSTQRLNSANMTAFEVVAMGRYPYTGVFGKLQRADVEVIEASMLKCGLKDLQKREFSTLSDGERQRTVIARALAQETELILMDEPTSFLDIRGKSEVFELLSALSTNRLVIFSTHEIEFALRTATDFWLVDETNVFSTLNKTEIEQNELLNNLYAKPLI
jgi:iron complex transport system ATP-binding protein